jgi:uncharacterized membrane protein
LTHLVVRIYAHRVGRSKKEHGRNFNTDLAFYFRIMNQHLRNSIWSVLCNLSQAKGRKGVTMDFAIILIVSNTLLAAFIYFVVTRIWQD